MQTAFFRSFKSNQPAWNTSIFGMLSTSERKLIPSCRNYLYFFLLSLFHFHSHSVWKRLLTDKLLDPFAFGIATFKSGVGCCKLIIFILWTTEKATKFSTLDLTGAFFLLSQFFLQLMRPEYSNWSESNDKWSNQDENFFRRK